MYIPAGEKEPFDVKFALDLDKWKLSVENFRLKCKLQSFWIEEIDRYINVDADFIRDQGKEIIKFTYLQKEYEHILKPEDYDSITHFYIHDDDRESFICYCVNLIDDGIYFSTGAEEVRSMNSYYDIFLDILFDNFPFDQYNLFAFCSDFLSHFGSYYQSIGIRKKKEGDKCTKIEFPPIHITSD